MSNYDDLQPDLQPVIDQLRANRPEATALELDAIKQRVRARSSQPARRRTTRRAQLMKSRLVILTMLVLGMLLSTAGAGLALSGLSGHSNASIAVYGAETPTPPPTGATSPGGGGNVLGDQDSGTNVLPEDQTGGGTSPATKKAATQPARQVEAGANTGAQLPFTGFAAIPVLLGGIVLLSAGLVLRRRTGDDQR
jgi:hypothetical protein